MKVTSGECGKTRMWSQSPYSTPLCLCPWESKLIEVVYQTSTELVGRVSQMVKYMPSQYEVLSSNSSMAKNKNQKTQGQGSYFK
jgi:hypothetical protein